MWEKSPPAVMQIGQLEFGLSIWKGQRDIGGAFTIPVISKEVQMDFGSMGCRATGLRVSISSYSDSGSFTLLPLSFSLLPNGCHIFILAIRVLIYIYNRVI